MALNLQVPNQPKPLDEVSLWPLIEGRQELRPKPIAFQTVDGTEARKRERFGSPPFALIDNRYKLLSYLDEGNPEDDLLFDLVLDPAERYNLAKEKPEVVRQMKQELARWKQSCERSERGEDYR